MAPRYSIAMLETLVAFVNERSLTAVAKRLRVSQPAVSSNLARFEQICGFALVRRSPGGSELTPAGRELAVIADEALRVVDRVGRRIDDLAAGGVRPLRIAASMTIAEYLLPDWIGWTEGLEMSDIELIVGNSEMVTSFVERGTADVGFVEGARAEPALTNVVVGEDRLVVVASPDRARRFAERGHGLAELVDEPLFLRERGSGTREVFDAEIERHGRSLGRLATSLGSTSAIKTAVRRGAGMGVVSELAVQDEFAAGTLEEVVTGRELDLRRRLRAVWVPGQRLDDRAAALIGAARSGPQDVKLRGTRV